MASNDVIVRLVADVDSLTTGMKNAQTQIDSLKTKTEGVGSSIDSSFKKIAGVLAGAFAVDKIKDFTVKMIEATASVNALDSQFESTFKSDQGKALEGITKQAQEQNINVDRLKGSWASFYGTFKGNGADANQSLELTSRYMKLAGDGSAYYDQSLEEVVSRLKSITMGNFEAGDAIGLNLNVTKLDTIAKKKYSKSWQDLNDTQKEFLVLDTAEQIYQNSGAMGQGSREANNWSNVLGNLKATWERLLSVVGQPTLQLATNIVVGLTSKLQEAVGFVKNFSYWFSDAYNETQSFAIGLGVAIEQTTGLSGLADAVMNVGIFLEDAVDSVSNLVSWWSQMGTGATILTVAITSLVTALIGFNLWLKAGAIASGFFTAVETVQLAVTTALNVATGLLAGFMAFLTSPIGIVIAVIGALIGVGIALYKNWDTVKAKAGELGAWLGQVWANVCTWTSQAWAGIVAWISGAWNSITASVSNGFTAIVQWFTNGWNSVVATCSNAWTWICATVTAGFVAVVQWFTTGWNTVVSACQTAWNFIVSVIQVGILLVVSVITALFTLITIPIMFVWENIKTYIFEAWNLICGIVTTGITNVINAVTVFFTPIIAFFVSVWDSIVNTVTTVWNNVTTFLTTVWNGIVSIATTVWTAYQTFITTVFNAVRDFLTEVWNTIKSNLTTVWNNIVDVATTLWNGFKTTVTTIFNAVKDFLTSTWNTIKSSLNTVWNEIVSLGTTAWNSLKTAIATAIGNLQTTLSEKWNSIKSTASSIWDGISSAISGVANGISSSVSGVFNGLKSSVTSIWNSIKSAMTQPIEEAKNKIQGLVDAVKSMFNFTLQFPKPRMPHFSLTGEFSLEKKTVPHLDVSWYKTGGIFTGASVVGIGEAGAEAVVPLSNKSRMKPFAQAVATMMPDNVDRGSLSSADAGVNIQVGQLVVREEADIKRIAQELFKLQQRNSRRAGVV